jgi:hypothetical protein
MLLHIFDTQIETQKMCKSTLFCPYHREALSLRKMLEELNGKCIEFDGVFVVECAVVHRMHSQMHDAVQERASERQ